MADILQHEFLRSPTGEIPIPDVSKLNLDVRFEALPTPVKSPSDKKEYKVIRLENGLVACLVADVLADESSEKKQNYDLEIAKDQKMAAASLSINVGGLSDPKAVPGMAHFLEHMVFMGSEKYPEENDFAAFVGKRGGYFNASTGYEETTFYFECFEKYFHETLDKFAQFFIAPLIRRDSINREREAVESEFQMARPHNGFRTRQLLNSFADSSFPGNFFCWGNLLTLRDNIKEDDLFNGIHEFRKRHYSAHRMTLAIQARFPIEVLQALVLDCFGTIPSNNLAPNNFTQYTNVFGTPEFSKLYYIQPINETTEIHLNWALPPLLHKYKSRPHRYVSWLLGDEGVGSLLSYFKKKVWALDFTAGVSESYDCYTSVYAMFVVTLTLTDEGLSNIYEIIENIFSYINMLKQLGPQEHIFNEIKQIDDNSFRFSDEGTAVQNVCMLSGDMHLYPPQDFLSGSKLVVEFDPSGINMVLDNLVPNKMNVTIICNNLPAGLFYDKTEKWCGAKYTQQEIPEDWMEKWTNAKPSSHFAIPPPNPFLIEDFQILNEDEVHPEFPEKVLATEIMELWYRKDQKFKRPFTYCKLYLITPLAQESPSKCVMTYFLTRLLHIHLQEETYPAYKVGFSCDLSLSDQGIILEVSGYNEKLPMFFEVITKHLMTFVSSLTETLFEGIKEIISKEYYNWLLEPTLLENDLMLNVLTHKFYQPLIDKYEASFSITFQDFKRFSRIFFEKLYIKGLIQGNVTEHLATEIMNNMVSILNCGPLEPNTYPKIRVTQIPIGDSICKVESFNKNNSNSIVTNYYQAGPFSIKLSVLIELITLIIQEPLFDALRTKQQLGYYVYCYPRKHFGILGLILTVVTQVTKYSTHYVDQRINEFVRDTSEALSQMSEKLFEETKRDLIKTKRRTITQLQDEVFRNWSKIVDEDYDFGMHYREIEAIQQLEISEVRDWWTLNMCSKENFRKFNIQVVGHDINKNNAIENTDKDQLSKNKEKKLMMIFLEADDVEKEERLHGFYVKNLADFKGNLYLYPLITKSIF